MPRPSGGVAIIEVGAATETEMKEKKHRMEDALSATRAAIEEGVVPGGGITLLNLAPALAQIEGTPEELVGISIVKRALEEPTRLIAENAGAEGSVVVERIKGMEKGTGFNAVSGEYQDMMKAGIIDPAKVTRVALENAASIGAMLLTTEALVGEIPEEEKAPAGPPMGGGMPGMC